MSLRDTIRDYLTEHGFDEDEVCSNIEYLETVHDVLLTLSRPPSARVPAPITYRVWEDSVGWTTANQEYRNALRVSVDTPSPHDAVAVHNFPPKYRAAWLDPSRLTPQQATALGVEIPSQVPVPESIKPPKAPPPPPPDKSPDAARKKLQSMIARDNARLSPSRRFAKSSAAQLLSESE